ncbi:hypothetical protein V12B01_12920 [Vibrio splendidus 12B01]|nr:hypothetical protein V12B01_12920 [Vibrio splendidus 12B01]
MLEEVTKLRFEQLTVVIALTQ